MALNKIINTKSSFIFRFLTGAVRGCNYDGMSLNNIRNAKSSKQLLDFHTETLRRNYDGMALNKIRNTKSSIIFRFLTQGQAEDVITTGS